MVNRVGIVEKAEQVKDLGSFAGDCKEQEHDSSLEEEEFWDFDSDDDACSYCRTCQLRRRLEKRLAAKKMLHQLEANEDHIRRVKEDNRQPSEDHRSIEDLLRFIGEDSGGEKQKSKGGVAGSKKSNSRSNKKKGRKKQSYKSMGGEMSKSSKSSEQMHGCNGIEDEESGNSGGSWLSKTSHKAFVETSSMPKRASNHPQDVSTSYSTVLDKDVEDWEADIEAEVEAFRKRLEELSAPLKDKPKVGAIAQLNTTCEQSLRRHAMRFHETNENSNNSKARSVGILWS